MALTANPQSAFRREPAWEQVIVPTLRKRLQDESRVLAKRMSATSITSDDGQPNLQYQPEVTRERVASPTHTYAKPSAIPRPSLQHSRTETSSSSIGRSSNSGSFKRPRTNSQPFPFEPADGSSPPMPQQQPTRSESPYVQPAKTTRIPVSRGRTGSTSSFQPSINGRSDSRTGLSKMNGSAYAYDTTTTPAADLYPVHEVQASSVNSRSTAFRTPRSQFSELAQEQAPFNANSVSSRNYNYQTPDYAPPRPSEDSEERPFEHWYRGDVSRNGGVGELRVARRQEMLDIANYGHTVRLAGSRLAGNGRPRAGSMGARERESIYLDEESETKAAMVLDEQPLTDLDSDGEDDEDDYDDGEGDEDMTERAEYSPPMNGSVSPPQPTYDRSTTPTSTKELNKATFQSRIPTPTPRAFAEPPRTPTPTQSQALSAPSTPRSRSATQTQTQSTLSATNSAASSAKRRGKSPSATTNAAKKARTSKSKSPAKQQKKDEQRRSASVYPSPDGDDIAHAIPSWTQPVEVNGNWDDVVLPAVARKKGLDGYEKADGSPKPKPPAPQMYEPAPGTFGYDHSKYRPPRASMDQADIPMDEFGQRKESPPPRSPPPVSPIRAQPAPSPQPSFLRRVESPAPFAHYASDDGGIGAAPGVTDMPPPPLVMEQREEDGGGCCKLFKCFI
ncbi:hypothetical protein EIP91_002554 [Steccherinum ochraceum]|uniref:Uncharacterized protein n=1 Tax=Steccherinum ochraceum TaxID=92696 RepID=A0A4R0REG5_9APHY|nr:hypothetical protein EIP91_002554 [Steccherinum ochraceum]